MENSKAEQRAEVLRILSRMKEKYSSEGFGAVSRVAEISRELKMAFGRKVDLFQLIVQTMIL